MEIMIKSIKTFLFNDRDETLSGTINTYLNDPFLIDLSKSFCFIL